MKRTTEESSSIAIQSVIIVSANDSSTFLQTTDGKRQKELSEQQQNLKEPFKRTTNHSFFDFA
jgi:DNA-binding LytR/AlgR family response regulator